LLVVKYDAIGLLIIKFWATNRSVEGDKYVRLSLDFAQNDFSRLNHAN
jgi:hypothetical protein